MAKNSTNFIYHTACQFLIWVGLFIPLTVWAQQVDTLQLLYHWSDSSLEGSSQYDNAYNEVWGFVQNGMEYAVIGSTAGTHIIPLDDKSVEPIFIEGSSKGPSVIHRDYHDYKGYLYAVCDEGQNASLQIMDIRDVPNGVNVVYDSNEYFSRAHNIFIDSSSAKLYVCSHKAGTYHFLGLYDISDPESPSQLGTYFGFQGQGGPVHDAFVLRDTAFLNCGGDGLIIVDFTDTDNPELINSLTDYPFRGYNHSGWATPDLDYYYMADENHGFEMKIIQIDPSFELDVIGTFNAGNPSEYSIPHNLLINCNYLYVSYYFDGLQIYDISKPESPERKYVYTTSTIEPHRNYKGAWGVYPFLPSGRVLVSDMQEGLFVLQGPDCDIETKVEDMIPLSFKVYPNPSFGQFRMSLPATDDDVFVQIINMDGKVVHEQKYQLPETLISPQLKAGVYLIQASTKSKIGQQLLIISP